MAGSGSVPTLPKAAPKKNLKRIMLARPDEEVPTLDDAKAQAIVLSISKYIEQFESRNMLKRHIVLGFNSISRKVELCDEDLVVVLLNGRVKPKLMLSTLFKLCVHKKVPVACLENFESLCQVLSPLFKGLKQNFVALGILAQCSKELQNSIVEQLPQMLAPEAAVSDKDSDVPTYADDLEREIAQCKRVRLRTPAAPKVHVSDFYIAHSEASTFLRSNGLTTTSTCDRLDFAEGTIPFVDYDSFIGSERPLIEPQLAMEVDDGARENHSTYKAPCMKSR